MYTYTHHSYLHSFAFSLFLVSSSNYIVNADFTLTISGVLSENAGMYRCAYEVTDRDVYLYSKYGRLSYLGEGTIYVCGSVEMINSFVP